VPDSDKAVGAGEPAALSGKLKAVPAATVKVAALVKVGGAGTTVTDHWTGGEERKKPPPTWLASMTQVPAAM